MTEPKVAYLDPAAWERFWAKANTSATPARVDMCWEWTGSRDAHGYGMFRVGPGVVRRAHRLSYEYVHGPVEDGTVFLHSCDNPPCIRPSHLRIGTRAENNADRDAKGRQRSHRGEDHGMAKLTEEAVREIRATDMSKRDGATRRLAERFGVSVANISRIRAGYSWRHVS